MLVVKPNPEGEKGKKKARIVVCGNFQTVHQDEMTSSKTPSYPMLRMLLSLASYQGWPIETWDVSTAFLYARLYGDRDMDLDGQLIFMRPPRVIEKLGLLPEGTICKLKKALYGLRTSPLAWEVERDNTLAQLQWEVEKCWYGLVPQRAIHACGPLLNLTRRIAICPEWPVLQRKTKTQGTTMDSLQWPPSVARLESKQKAKRDQCAFWEAW